MSRHDWLFRIAFVTVLFEAQGQRQQLVERVYPRLESVLVPEWGMALRLPLGRDKTSESLFDSYWNGLRIGDQRF